MALRCTIQMVIETLHSKVGVPLDTPNIDTASWEEMGVESLGLTEVCTSLEHQFGIVIPNEEVFSLGNIREFVRFVNSIQS